MELNTGQLRGSGAARFIQGLRRFERLGTFLDYEWEPALMTPLTPAAQLRRPLSEAPRRYCWWVVACQAMPGLLADVGHVVRDVERDAPLPAWLAVRRAAS